MTFFGMLMDLAVVFAVAALLERLLGVRPWVAPVARAGSLLVAYGVLVLLMAPFFDGVREATVDPVDGLPAALAGVQKGDRVLAVDGRSVRDFDELSNRVRAAEQTVTLTVERGGLPRDLSVRRTSDGAVGVRPSGEVRSQTWAERGLNPYHAFVAAAATLGHLIGGTVEYQTVGGPVMLVSGTSMKPPWVNLAFALAAGGAMWFPLVLVLMAVSVWVRPRLLA